MQELTPIWKHVLKGLLILWVAYVCISCTQANLLQEFGDKTTNEALYHDAKMLMNDSNWTEAINKFGAMSAEYLARRDVAATYASAYAGRCGLDFLAIVAELPELGTLKLLKFLMRAYPAGTAAHLADCKQAETLVNTIEATATDRTTDENLLMVLLSFAKIGRVLSRYADTTGDGEPDAGFDSCASGDLPDADAAEVITGVANALTSLNAIASDIDIGSDQLTTLTTFCSTLASTAPTYNFCAVTDTADVDANMLKGIRSMIRENQYLGIGSCNNTLANCLCP